MTDPTAEAPATPGNADSPAGRPSGASLAQPGERQPGERPPATRLSRPPSDRYASGTSVGSGPSDGDASGRSDGSGPSSASARASKVGVAGPALVAAFVTIGVLIVVGGALAEHRGLFAISGLGGGAIGLLIARGAASPDGTTRAAWSRREAARIAVGLALATVLVAAVGIWVLSRVEGGVMDPLAYLWETTGLLIPAQAAVAVLAAAWGARAGPIRWRE